MPCVIDAKLDVLVGKNARSTNACESHAAEVTNVHFWLLKHEVRMYIRLENCHSFSYLERGGSRGSAEGSPVYSTSPGSSHEYWDEAFSLVNSLVLH